MFPLLEIIHLSSQTTFCLLYCAYREAVKINNRYIIVVIKKKKKNKVKNTNNVTIHSQLKYSV